MSEIDQLERILKSAPLVSSPSLSRFLRYIVEEALAGRSANIREFTLGVNVFDRGEDFNPRLDPIVRVQARNLRARVAKYYETYGAEDPIYIELPKGTYVPIFHNRLSEPMAPERRAAVPASIMPVPPPRSPVAEPREVSRATSRYLIAGVILLVILIGLATLWLAQTHAAPGLVQPGTLAQDFYIRGRYALDRESGASLRESIKNFEQALEHAPNYAAAHAGLADAYNILSQFGLTAPREAMEKARAEALRAIEIDPRLAEGHVSLAAILEAYDWNWKGAEREYRRALQLSPGLAAAHLWYGMFLRDQGRLAEALPELRRAAQLQPSSVLTTVNLAYGLLEQGDPAAALEQARRAVEMAPDHPTASILLVYAAQAMKKPEDAQAALAQAQRAAAGNPHSLAMVACALARSGRRDESLRLSQQLDELSHTQYVSPYDLGKVSLMLGDEDRAFGFFEEAVRQRSSGVIFLRNVRGCVRNTGRFDSLVGQLHMQS